MALARRFSHSSLSKQTSQSEYAHGWPASAPGLSLPTPAPAATNIVAAIRSARAHALDHSRRHHARRLSRSCPRETLCPAGRRRVDGSCAAWVRPARADVACALRCSRGLIRAEQQRLIAGMHSILEMYARAPATTRTHARTTHARTHYARTHYARTRTPSAACNLSCRPRCNS